MLFFQKVKLSVDELPKRDDPLYVGHFFELDHMWWEKRRVRQDLIFSIAITWYRLIRRQISAPGMIEDELMLTRLTSEVRDARVIIEKFFTITRLGFNLGDGVNRSPTVVSPKKLPNSFIKSIERHIHKLVHDPGPEPTSAHLVKTVVNIRQNKAIEILAQLKAEGREDLEPSIKYLLKSPSHNFYYRPAGRLQARDTSVWPIKAIETYPSWLRSELFGTTVDIENAFCQFLLYHLEPKHAQNPKLLQLKYPDIIQAAYDKKNFRENICRNVLHLPLHEDNINAVKKLVMAIANGSNASAGLMTSDSRSQAVHIVKQFAPHLSPTQMIAAGDRLKRIASQFRDAKKELALYLFKEKPTRENQKRIFQEYFAWERVARYKLWDVVGHTGLALHDGLDGIIDDEPSTLAHRVFERTGLRVSVDIVE